MRFDLLINTMYAHAHRDGVVTVNNASIWRPIFAMTDVINVFQRALEAPVEKAGTYNVFSENISIGDAAERVKAFFKKKHGMDIAVDIKEVQDVRNYRAVNEKAIRDLDISFEGSVESILEDIDSQIPADTDFNDEKYYNIRTFKNVLSQ